MRTRSLTGPLLLLIVGGLFLWRNLHPDTPVFELIAQYWPFLLIGWGVLRLAEVAFWSQARTRAFSGGVGGAGGDRQDGHRSGLDEP